MANKIRGQRSFQVEGETYTVHFDMNALAELEDALDMTVPEISEKMQDTERIGIKFMRTMLWVGLLRHHDFSIDEAGELMSKGDINEIFTAVGEALATSLMTEEQIKQAEQMMKENQKKVALQAQKKRSGTGRR